MIKELFISVLNMSITASFAIMAVILIRFLIKKQPKIISYILWSVVLFRLLCPWSLPSRISIYNSLPMAETTIKGQIIYNITELTEDETTAIQDITVNNAISNITYDNSDKENLIIHHNITPDYTATLAGIWILGIVFLIIKNIISLYEIRKLLFFSNKEQNNIYTNDRINTAFVFGIINPGIYLPENIDDKRKKYIIRHETVHIKRKDYIFKLMGFAALCIHWFNPLVWLAFTMAEKDMEMACDEAVIKNMNSDETIGYSQTLLMLSSGVSLFPATAFSEKNTKERMANILNYKNIPQKYIIILSAALLAAVGVFAVNPLLNQKTVTENNSSTDEAINSAYTDEKFEFHLKSDESLDVMAETAAQIYFNNLNEPENYTLVNYTLSRPAEDKNHSLAYMPYIDGNKFIYTVLIEYDYEGRTDDSPLSQEVLYIVPLENNRYKIIGVVPPVPAEIITTENSGSHIWPLFGGRISRGYSGQYPAHNGLDIAADIGTHIFAVADGTVITVENINMGYGIHCIIDHGDYKTLYAHCDGLEVTEGQKVLQGQLIGYVGSTGNSTGPHLHMEIFTQEGTEKITENPMEYF